MRNNFIINESMLDDHPPVRLPQLKNDKVVLLSGRVRSGKTVCLVHKLKQLLVMNRSTESVDIRVDSHTIFETGNYAMRNIEQFLWIAPNSVYKSFLNSIFRIFGISCIIETINEFFKKDGRTFDYVFIDETSFLTEEQLQKIASATTKSLILSLTEGDVLPAFFFKDDEKGIDAKTISKHFGITPQCLLFMHINNGTKRLISKLYEDGAIVTECIVDSYPHNCRYKEFANGESVEEFIMKSIVHRNEENVGILYFTNDEVSDSYRKFRELKYKVECNYGGAFDWKNNINFDTTLPKLLTIHSSVGISFDTVYIVLDERVASNVKGYRDLVAYALTRGLRDVVIVSNYSLPPIIKNNATPICDGNVIFEI